jgi:hypothetical protein
MELGAIEIPVILKPYLNLYNEKDLLIILRANIIEKLKGKDDLCWINECKDNIPKLASLIEIIWEDIFDNEVPGKNGIIKGHHKIIVFNTNLSESSLAWLRIIETTMVLNNSSFTQVDILLVFGTKEDFEKLNTPRVVKKWKEKRKL